MSIKIFTDDSRLILFLLVSILLHIGILFIAPQAKDSKKALPRLLPVDIVKIPQPEKIKTNDRRAEIKKQMPEKERERPLPQLLKNEKPQALFPKEKVLTEKPLQAEVKPLEPEGKEISPAIPLQKKQEKPLTLYPTNERISELSKEYERETPVAEKGRDISFDTSEPRFTSYFEGLKAKIYHEWEYPDAAARAGWAGRLWVRFIIKKDGSLEEVTLIRGSGYPMLDDAALSAIRLAAPFYSFPKTFGSLERITINASFEYLLENLPPLIKGRH